MHLKAIFSGSFVLTKMMRCHKYSKEWNRIRWMDGWMDRSMDGSMDDAVLQPFHQYCCHINLKVPSKIAADNTFIISTFIF